jgi:hypothetical protein
VFDEALLTPTRAIIVSIVPGHGILEARASSSVTRFRVWTNHPTEPDDVIIGLD